MPTGPCSGQNQVGQIIRNERGCAKMWMRIQRACVLLFIGVAFAESCSAELRLASIFSDGMVLQREQNVPVWGWSEPGETVTVMFAGQKKSGRANENGKWTVLLDPLPASSAPQTLQVSGSGFPVTVRNVLVGEVWLCSGQSNMLMPVRDVLHSAEEGADADFPSIRMFMVKIALNPEIQEECEGHWVICSPKSVGQYSAVAYFFGRRLHQELGVPIGLIRSAWGGSPCQGWAPLSSLDNFEVVQRYKKAMDLQSSRFDQSTVDAKYEEQLAKWQQRVDEATASGKKPPNKPKKMEDPRWTNQYPGNLYNAMLHPLVPYGMRGAIWYQGENNSKPMENALQYKDLLKNMVEQWRKAWGSDFPFYAVQLPSFAPGLGKYEGWRQVREAVLDFQKEVPNTGMAVAVDVGDPKDIHPKNKKPVGDRLARQALAKTYGFDLMADGPIFRAMKKTGDRLVLFFDEIGSGLTVKHGDTLQWFMLAGEDENFVSAGASIVGDTVVVHSEQVADPIYVRYAWENNPKGGLLFNKEGLPASPFRTDKRN